MYFVAAKRLTHQGAKQMASVAISRARDAGIAIAVAITDAGGHLMLLERMDGGRFHTVHSAMSGGDWETDALIAREAVAAIGASSSI